MNHWIQSYLPHLTLLMLSSLFGKGLQILQRGQLSLYNNEIEFIIIFKFKIPFVPRSISYPLLNTREAMLLESISIRKQGGERS